MRVPAAAMWLLLVCGVFHCLSAYEIDPQKLQGLAKAKVEVGHPERVKAFVTQDIPLYHNLVMKHVPGADPELVLLSHYYEELDRIPLSDMTRAEINNLLRSLGFYKKANQDDPVPEEFQFSPAKDSPWREKRESQTQSSPEATSETSIPESGRTDL
ncbi:selenoprotein M-like [Arapaima gigas]